MHSKSEFFAVDIYMLDYVSTFFQRVTIKMPSFSRSGTCNFLLKIREFLFYKLKSLFFRLKVEHRRQFLVFSELL